MKLFLGSLFFYVLLISGCDNRPGVQWEKFTTESMLKAKQNHQPVFADFYAAWCGPCMIMKDTTFKDPQVIEALELFARFRADMSFRESEHTIDLARRYQIDGLPTVILFNSEGKEVVRTHFVTAKQLLQMLRQFSAGQEPAS